MTDPFDRIAAENTYAICFCGGLIRFTEDGDRIPCPCCGSTLTREEALEAAKEAP